MTFHLCIRSFKIFCNVFALYLITWWPPMFLQLVKIIWTDFCQHHWCLGAFNIFQIWAANKFFFHWRCMDMNKWWPMTRHKLKLYKSLKIPIPAIIHVMVLALPLLKTLMILWTPKFLKILLFLVTRWPSLKSMIALLSI